MKRYSKQLSAVLLVFALSTTLVAKTFTVSKDGRGAYTSIQDAVDAAGKNDIVKILDNAVYEEQVTIDSSKAGLLLTSENPESQSKPTIKWQDTDHVHPTTCNEAHNEETIDFDRNGALRTLRTRNITIDGIKIDGGGVYPFGANGIWDEGSVQCKWPLQHGNTAVNLWLSGDIIIRNCDISNAYIGINVKDRNEGGIFANANPADIEPWNVVPLSGFAKSGNHLIEQNRIHDNSWGIFFESTWDLGSVLRYNLIYENHHPDNATAKEVKGLTSDGNNHPGGALWFKDHALSPLAIYNNTFRHNFLVFSGHWRPGSQHLIFNNIYGKPHTYWSDDPNFQNPFHKLDHAFINRMKHSVYAAQTRKPTPRTVEVQEYDQGIQAMVKETLTTYEVRIMNDFGEVEQITISHDLDLSTGTVTKSVTGMRIPGNKIIGQSGKPFPAEANIRWFETPFKSTDPASPDFLVPDWDDPLVKQFIIDQGWPEAGVRDADGTIADLGAIPFGGTPTTVATIKPLAPLIINGTDATMRFDLKVMEGTFNNPKVKYFRFIKNVGFQADPFGGNVKPIPASDIIETSIPSKAVKIGQNTFTVTVPSRSDDEYYAFFEIIIEGTDENGNLVTSTVGFMPYRKMDYSLKVTVLDIAGTTQLSEVQAGDTVKLKIEALKADGTSFASKIDPVEVSLNSGFDLLTHQFEVFSLPEGIEISVTKPAVFTKVPDGGLEYVMASGLWTDISEGNNLAFFGASDAIRILPGDPDKVIFEDPPSKTVAGSQPPVIDPGQIYDVSLQVYDRFDNKIDQKTQVSITSEQPSIGDIDGPSSGLTDTTGAIMFNAKVTNGGLDEVFTLTATLAATGHTDQADLKVGKARDKFWVFYSDTASYNASVELRGAAGPERYPVVVRAGTDGSDILTERTTEFSVNVSSGIAVYGSSSPDDTIPDYTFSLLNGETTIWLRGTGIVNNGNITVEPVSDNTILSGYRENIYFSKQSSEIEKATVYANNGYGKVDSLDIYYLKELQARPDSIVLYWPSKGDDTKKTIVYGITLDPSNKRHITVKLPDPFPADLTTFTATDILGVHYWYDPSTPEIKAEQSPFAVRDGVGPLLASAQLVERLEPGSDTLFITFTESIKLELLMGASLTLEKATDGSEVDLTVFDTEIIGTTIRVVVKDEGDNAPESGDKLRINSDGPLTDAYGNSAHPENRPVQLSLKPIPASISKAWYLDENADGIVDAAMIAFNKAVDWSTLSCSFTWTNTNNTLDLRGDKVIYSKNDSSLVRVDLREAFTKSVDGITSGEMNVTVTDSGFDNATIKGTVEDSAAPVLAEATFRPGAIDENDGTMPDTLDVKFSETVSSSHGSSPYLFLQTSSGTEYTMVLDSLSWGGRQYRYIVSSIEGAHYPSSQDSMWINHKDFVEDIYGNIQDNENNRRILLQTGKRPVKLDVSVSDNPFQPGKTNLPSFIQNASRYGTAIIVKLSSKDPNAELEGTVAVFDAVGNVIVPSTKLVKEDNSDKSYFIWDGRNMNGRYVGSGSYLAIVETISNNNDRKLTKLKIGVLR
ncbi:MAG: hypothetical protein GF401_11720 [Chitinivibrionales bacterium]|nr:hypothetical protein [Chitinivibrionales bacterium]